MTKKMGLMALGLSMALLSGCVSTNDDDDIDDGISPTANLNTPDETAKNIIASWASVCREDDGEYEVETLIFEADGNAVMKKAQYLTRECNSDEEIASRQETFSYDIGEAVTSLDGKEAVELNIHGEDEGESMNYYSMTHFHDPHTLFIANEPEDADIEDDDWGDTPETRESDFTNPQIWYRQ